MRAIRFAAGILALLIGAVVTDAQTARSYLLYTGTLVDPLRGYSYVAVPGGSIQAVDLRTGGMLWTSRSALVPLGANDFYVAAQEEVSRPGALSVVFLDIRNGSPVSQANIPLPANVTPVIGVSLYSGQFVAIAEVKGNDFDVSWYYEAPTGDACCPPVILYAGAARVDPRTGAILALDPGVVVTDLPAWTATYDATPGPPWRSGNVYASPSVGSDSSITLKRTSIYSGAQFPDVLLSSHANFVTASLDSQYLFVEEGRVPGSGLFTSYHVLIFGTESGERIGDFITEFPNIAFVVVDGAMITFSEGIIYYQPTQRVVPPALVALSLPSGAVKWSVPRLDLSGGINGPATNPPLRRAVRH